YAQSGSGNGLTQVRSYSRWYYGHRHDALEAIGRVRKIHTRIIGTLPDGTPYRADDPALLAWVHLTETISFLDAWCRFAEPRMSQIDRDAYVHDMARIGRLLGADPVPDTEFEARRQMQRSRVMLTCDMRTDTVRDLLLDQPLSLPGGRATQRLLMQAAIDLLPFWARRLHGIPSSGPGMPAVSAATLGMARTIRWAFRN
ncbi:oxygenase MpaB family protein, partial [Tanticharoenia sakaeratensis]|uniref:oxygenase MpaB family protein n=2 Tax=Tanticharoenia sakaeratensis TaxID=444053 RepID=UPI00223166C9